MLPRPRRRLMCGRYALTLPPEAVRAFFSYVEQPNFPPRFNIAPTQPIAIVRREADSANRAARHFHLVRWGFVPTFVKDFGSFRPLVNARSEGVADKPSFRNAFRRRRCLVVADGFYEWRQQKPAPSQPFLIRRPDRAPMGLAGLYETWIGADGSEIETACILTTDANGTLAGIHPRMPVLIAPADFDLWLDPDERSAPEAETLLRPADNQTVEALAIGPQINRVAVDDETVQQPLPGTPAPAVPQPSPPWGDAQGSLF